MTEFSPDKNWNAVVYPKQVNNLADKAWNSRFTQ
jgi:hypothetical protein